MTGADALINHDYTFWQLAFFAGGGAFWVVAYVAVLRGIWRHGVIEIPAAAVACNMAWETTWGMLFQSDLGQLFVWGYRTWFVLDLFIFAALLRTGVQHLKAGPLRQWFRPGVVLSFLCWLTLFVAMNNDPGEGRRFETSTGIVSGFIATVFMSTVFLLVELERIDGDQYSAVVAWSKLLGNGLASVFCVLRYPDNHLLLSLCAITLVLDILYMPRYRSRLTTAPRIRTPAV